MKMIAVTLDLQYESLAI